DAEHPWLVRRLLPDPFNGPVGFHHRAVSAAARIGGGNDFDAAIGPIDDPFAGVITVLHAEIDIRGAGRAAGLPRVEDAAALHAGTPRCGCRGRRQGVAATV